MKTKTIPFDLELAKKIQAGEIKGEIKTRDGRKARILCSDMHNFYPLVAAITIDDTSGKEALYALCSNGMHINTETETDTDLVLEVPDDEPQFKPFDRVLVRDEDAEEWETAHFSHTQNYSGNTEYIANNIRWLQCIPYEGNENLVGTRNKPKEE